MRGRGTLVSAFVATGIVLGLIVSLAGLSGTLDPLERTVCAKGSTIYTSGFGQIPAVLMNAPYGGSVLGTAYFPASLRNSTVPVGIEAGDSNGGADSAGIGAKVSVAALTNQTALGPGVSRSCTHPFVASVVLVGGIWLGTQIMGPGNRSDAAEPTVLLDYPSNISFANGFDAANSANISTCGGPAQTAALTSNFLTLWVTFASGGTAHSVSFEVPIATDQFSYTFPADFGTWAVDNLSEPAGPGGGWAFDYLGPCL